MGLNDAGIGGALRAERLRQRWSIEYIARETRISPRMLDAIERDDLESLPGLLFTRNFVKQYALALRLDPAPFLDALPALDIESAPMPQLQEREREKLAWNPAWNSAIASVVWIMAAAAAAGAAYVHFSRPVLDQIRQKSAAAAVITPKPAAEPVSAPTLATPAPGDPVKTPARPEETPSAAPPLRKVAETTTRNAGNSSVNSPHKVNVLIQARADSWIEVSEDGKSVFSGILKSNESREFSSDDAIKLVAGNAGGITVSLNGHALNSLGAEGQVRTLRLTEAGPQALSRPPQAAPSQL